MVTRSELPCGPEEIVYCRELSLTARQVDGDRDILAGLVIRGLALDWGEDEREDFRTLVDSLDDPVLAPRLLGVSAPSARGRIPARSWQPKSQWTSSHAAAIRGDGVAEDVADGPHEVVADDRILGRT